MLTIARVHSRLPEQTLLHENTQWLDNDTMKDRPITSWMNVQNFQYVFW